MNKISKIFDSFSRKATRLTGSSYGFAAAVAIVVAWAASGHFFHYSEMWQMIINTGTTIITFLMVFIIQQSNNKDTTAIQLKLNELIRAKASADNKLQSIEDLSEEELTVLKEKRKNEQ